MAKIDRYNGNLAAFAADALSTERTIFGDTAQSDTLDDNITADFLRGWEIVGVNENPTKQDFNGLAFTLGQLISYLHQRGIAEWNAAQEYFDGSVVTTLVGIYRLTSDGVGSSNPDTDDGDNWERVGGSDIDWELIPTQAEVDAKADQATTYTKTEVDELLDELLDDKADQDTTYTKTEVDELLDAKTDISGQTWQDVTSSRTRNVIYSNYTDQPITASITVNGYGWVEAYVDGIRVFNEDITTVAIITLVIPVGSTYKCDDGFETIASWAELR